MLKIYVISLKNSVERRKSVSQQLEALNLPFTFFDAYLGKDFCENPDYYDVKKAKKLIHRELKAGEVGCALSHNAVYKEIVKEKLPYALVLEDDIVISKDLPEVIESLLPYLTGSRIITLDRCDVYNKRTVIPLFNEYHLATPRYVREGGMANTSGYLITGEAAEKIASVNFPVWCPSDHWYAYHNEVTFNGIVPSQTVIHQNKGVFNSTIQSDGLGISEEINASTDDKEQLGYFTAPQLFIYSLKTFVPFTRHIYSFVRWTYRHTLKKLKKTGN